MHGSDAMCDASIGLHNPQDKISFLYAKFEDILKGLLRKWASACNTIKVWKITGDTN